MGRMKRQKRYKACDPFSKKTKQKVSGNDKYNLPPKGKNTAEFDDHFSETKSFKKFQRTLQMGNKTKQQNKLNNKETIPTFNKASKKLKSGTPKETQCKKLPSETKNQYFQRLDQNIQDAVNTSMMESKTLRKKRKLHLKSRNEKKKLKKQSVVDASDVPLKDTFIFGETVHAPPTISIAPRKAGGSGNKFQDLKLTSLLESGGKSKKIQNSVNKSDKESLDIERQCAIDAYRLMKKRKNIAMISS